MRNSFAKLKFTITTSSYSNGNQTSDNISANIKNDRDKGDKENNYINDTNSSYRKETDNSLILIKELHRILTMIEFVKDGDENILLVEQKKLWNKWTLSYKKEENKTWQGQEGRLSWKKVNSTLQKTIFLMESASNLQKNDNSTDEPLNGVQKSIEERIIDRIYEKGLIK